MQLMSVVRGSVSGIITTFFSFHIRFEFVQADKSLKHVNNFNETVSQVLFCQSEKSELKLIQSQDSQRHQETRFTADMVGEVGTLTCFSRL